MNNLLSTIFDGFSDIETHDESVTSIKMSPVIYKELTQQNIEGFTPSVTKAELIKNNFGLLYGASIYVLNNLEGIEIEGERGTKVIKLYQIRQENKDLKRKFKFILEV